MSDGDRGRFVAIGLAVLGFLTVLFGQSLYSYWLGNLSGQKEAETQSYQSEYAEHTDERISRCFDGVAASRECVEKAVRDNYEQQRAESDLNAQRNMADWAFWMLVVSSAGLGVTAIGTVFLAWQVKLTREAVEDTETATNAMLRQNELTEAAHRPWLTVRIKKLDGFQWDADGNFRCNYIIQVTNTGNAPALIVSEFVGIEPTKDEKFDESRFIELTHKLLRMRVGAVAPNSTESFAANRQLIDTDTVGPDGRFENGSIPGFVAGVSYQPPQGKRTHTTVLRLFVTGDALNRNRDKSKMIVAHVTKTHMS